MPAERDEMTAAKSLVGGLCALVIGSLAGWFACAPFLALLRVEGVEFIYTSLPGHYFLRLKVAGLFGLLGAAVFFGSTLPKPMTTPLRFLIIILPAAGCCFIVLMAKRALIAHVAVITNFGVTTSISITRVKIEHGPLAALVVTVVVSGLLFYKGRRI